MSSDPFKILIVDDSISIVSSLSQILKVSGYHVEPAYNGSEALRKMSHTNYDLVISDIDMPGINGLDFLGKIRAEFGQKVAVILMTGYLDQDYFINAIRLGANDFIRKPIDANQIIRSIRIITAKKKEQNDMGMFFAHLDKSEISFVIDPQHLASFSISNVFSFMLLHHFNVNSAMANEILVCIDEMIYNAYIHGTLQLDKSERFLNTTAFREMVEEKLQNPQIRERRIRLTVSIDSLHGIIMLEVEDDGEGFEHAAWLHRIKKDQTLNSEEYGRGISLLYHLSDALEFSKGGRAVRITKHLFPTGTAELANN